MSDFPLFCPLDCPPDFLTFPKNNFKFEFQRTYIFLKIEKPFSFVFCVLTSVKKRKPKLYFLLILCFNLSKKKTKKNGTLGTRIQSILNKTDCFLSVATYATTKSFIHISQCFNNIVFYFYVAYHRTYNMGSTCTRIYFYFPVGYGLY